MFTGLRSQPGTGMRVRPSGPKRHQMPARRGRPQPRASLCLQHEGAGTPAYEIPKENSSSAVSNDFSLMLKYSRSHLRTTWAEPRTVGAIREPRAVPQPVAGASASNPDAPGQTLRDAFSGSFQWFQGRRKCVSGEWQKAPSLPWGQRGAANNPPGVGPWAEKTAWTRGGVREGVAALR